MTVRTLRISTARLPGGEDKTPTSGPTANFDFASATANGADIIISPLDNDTDPAGGGLTITAASPLDSVAIITSGTQLRFTPGDPGTTMLSYTIEDVNGLTDTGQVEVTVEAASGDQSVSITANRTSGYAAAGFMFEATATGFADGGDPKRELRYKWDFGDPGSTFTAPDARFDATVNGRSLDFRNANIAYTYRAAHCYAPTRADFNGATSLQYSVTCTVIDRAGNQKTSPPITITVNNPDILTTVVFDPDGVFDEIPAEVSDAIQRTTIGSAWSALPSVGGQILIRRGRDIPDGLGFRGKTRLIVGAYGPEADAKPRFVNRSGFTLEKEGVDEFSVRDLAFQEDWDVLTETASAGPLEQKTCFTWNSWDSQGFDTIHNCEARDLTDRFAGNSIPPDNPWNRQIVFNNVKVRNFRNYGIQFRSARNIAFLGFSIFNDPMGLQGRGDKNLVNAHTPNRITYPPAGYMIILDAYQSECWHGWSGGTGWDYVSPPSPQGNFRLNPGDSTDTGGYRDAVDFNVSRVIAEGGNPTLGVPEKRSSNSGYTKQQIVGIVDKVILICSSPAITALTSYDAGAIVTNALLLAPPMKMLQTKDFDGMIAYNDDGADAEGSRVRGVTQVNWIDPVEHRHSSPARDFDEWTSGPFGKYASIWHYPNGITPSDLAAQLDLSLRLFAPKYVGLRYKDYLGNNGPVGALIEDFSYAAPDTFNQYGAADDQASLVIPVPLDGQLTTTADDAPIDDIFGDLRTGTIYRGCVQRQSVFP